MSYLETNKQHYVLIEGEPVAKARPRFTKSGRVYTPAKTKVFENLIKLKTKQAIKKPLEGAISLSIVVKVEPPSSWSKKRKQMAYDQDILKTTKPDLDNYIKAVMDGMNSIAYLDDNQIVELSAKKVYAQEACTIVKIEEVTG